MSEFQADDSGISAVRFFDAQSRYYAVGARTPISEQDEASLRYADSVLAAELTAAEPTVAAAAMRGWINTELAFVVPVDEADKANDVATDMFNVAADRALALGAFGQTAEAYMAITATHVYRQWSKDMPLSDEVWQGYREALASTADFVCDVGTEDLSTAEAQRMERVRYELVALMGLNAVRGNTRKPVKNVAASATYRQRLFYNNSLPKGTPRETWHATALQYNGSHATGSWSEHRRLLLSTTAKQPNLGDSVTFTRLSEVVDDPTPLGLNRMLIAQARTLRGLDCSETDVEKVANMQRHLKQLGK